MTNGIYPWSIQCNDQMKKDKRTNNDIQNTTQKTKEQATRIHT